MTSAPNPDRQLGRHYTPGILARRMVQAGLDALAPSGTLSSVRVLDPACGDGAFLVEVFEQLCARRAASGCDPAFIEPTGRLTPPARLEIVRESIFGVDVDPVAVDALRLDLLARIGATGSLAKTAVNVVAANIRLGDSLTGPGPARARQPMSAGKSRVRPFVHGERGQPAIDWDVAFPAAAAGFDLIVGNPPYVRERNARGLFYRVSVSELGLRWREARMDLWHYFAHRGLDLLRPGGILSFVVNSYWTASRGAHRLIERFETETRLEEIELLGNQPIFAGVSGRHLVFRARKINRTGAPEISVSRDECRRTDETTRAEAASEMCRIVVHPDFVGQSRKSGVASPTATQATVYHVPHGELFEKGRIVLALPDRLQSPPSGSIPVGDAFDTRQGMAENPPVVTRRLACNFSYAGPFTIGEGVFVLRPDEIERLKLTPRERGLLRPYFDTERLGRYHLPAQPERFVLYLTRSTAPTLDDLPNIARHLERFRSILQLRRETRLGKCAWHHLHWPRDESIFTRPRVLSIQMGRRPSFVFAERPTFVGFSVNLILRREADAPSLVALTGVLNSALAVEWFERHAKRRGIRLEINAGVLREFPLPSPDPEIERTLEQLVARRQELDNDESPAQAIEAEIESQVERWYRLPAKRRG